MDDLISRQAAINAIMEEPTDAHYPCWYKGIIEKLPSADRPTQKVGQWIITDDDYVYCSECEDSYYPRPIDASWYYCPHCGAKME